MTDQQDTQEEFSPVDVAKYFSEWTAVHPGKFTLNRFVMSAKAMEEENKRLRAFVSIIASKRTTMAGGAEVTQNNDPTLGELIDMAQELLGDKHD